MEQRTRIEWVDYAKGICIFAVVSMYSTMLAAKVLGDAGWFQHWADFAKPFRMPDFFLLSGLFLARVIDRPLRGYFDKKVIHYTYFFLLWTVINVAMLFAIGDLSGGLSGFVHEVWLKSSSWPWMMMWFIQMLPAYFLFTRLIRKVPVWIVLIGASLLQAFPPPHIDRVLVDEFWIRYIFFYVGYVGAPYFFRFAEYIRHRLLLGLVGLTAWAVMNSLFVQWSIAELPFVGLFLGLAGATAVVTLGSLASRFNSARWLRYLGQNSIVVYLAFYWPMQLAAQVFLGFSILTYNHTVFSILITATGIFGSLVLFWVVRGNVFTKWLFTRPRWLSIGGYDSKSIDWGHLWGHLFKSKRRV